MICTKCGATLADDARFCNGCGTPVESVPVEAENNEAAVEEVKSEEPAVEEQAVEPAAEEKTEVPAVEEQAEESSADAETVAETSDAAPAEEAASETPASAPAPAEEAASETPAPAPEESAAATPVKEPSKSGKKKLIPIIIICASALLLIGMAVAAVAIYLNVRTVKVDVSQYISFKYDGYSTIGTAEVKFNKSAFTDDYGKKLRYTKDGKEVFDGKEPAKAFTGLIQEAVPEGVYADYLTNGDEVVFVWNDRVVDRIEQYFKVELECSDVTATVEGLEIAPVVDVFENITFTVDGVAPNGMLRINGSNEYNLYYTPSKTTDLSNGDIITITASPMYSDENLSNYMIKNYGVLPKETEVTYTVEGLSSYVGSAKEIPADLMKQMQDQADSVAQAQLVTNTADEEKVVGTTCVGYYFLTAKDAKNNWNSKNIIIFVYKSVVHVHYERKGKTFDQDNVYYNWCTFSDIMLLADGTGSVDLGRYDTCTYTITTVDSGIDSGWYSTKKWSYKGYDSITSLKDNLVTKRIDAYDYEDCINKDLADAPVSGTTPTPTPAPTDTPAPDATEPAETTKATDTTETTETTGAAETTETT